VLQEGSTHRPYGRSEDYKKVYPDSELVVRRKETNVAGLQIADMIAYGQKVQTILEKGKPFAQPLSEFTKQLNGVVDKMVNQYGRYLLE